MVSDAPGSQSALRRANSTLVLRALTQEGPSSHAELARATGLSRASVTNIVRELEATGAVRTYGEVRAGRHARIAARVLPAKVVCAVNVGRDYLRVSLADLESNVLVESEVLAAQGHEPQVCLDQVPVILDGLLATVGRDREDLLGIVAGFPAPLDRTSRVIGTGALMRAWVGIDLQAELERRTDVTVTVENDANLGAIGEYRFGGYESEVENLIFIRITTGIGAGLVLGGRLHRGGSGVAGEIGHTAVDPAGPLCRCGNRGCLERYVVAPTTLDLDRIDRAELRSIDDLIRLAIDGEITCRRVIDDMASHLGTAVANLCNTLNPDVVVLSGPFTAVGELLLGPVRREMERRSVPEAARAVRIGTSRLGPQAEVLGALSWAVEIYADDPLAATT